MIFRRNVTSTATAPAQSQEFPAPSGRSRRMRASAVAAAITAAGLGFTAVGASVASAATSTATRTGGALPWSSGVYQPSATPKTLSTFGTWRGAPVTVATVWPGRSTWNDFVNPAWLYQIWKGAPQTVAFGEPMLPEGVAGVTLAACAAGSYNSYWKQFGTNISAYGLGNSIIRLGWEFNGNWYIWKATNPTTFAKCWQQIVTSARTTAPGLQWNWNVNRGKSSGLADPTQAYPGDAYVNTIGVDSYDAYPAATTTAGWNTQLNGTQGLMYWLNFAKTHGKKLAVPEWGNMNTGSSAGHDNPAYVNDMRAFFQAHSAILAWESNFQGPSTKGVYGTGTSIPKSSAAYQAGF
jgi:glycosyl hydrolase family 26